MIECKKYSLTELKQVLHISKRQWDSRRNELLEYLKLFFDYEISLIGRSYCFNIKEQYAEYEPLPRKTKYVEVASFYANEVDCILKYKPRNTGANLAREIIDKNNQWDHKEGTAANYIRPYLKKNYTITDKEWCAINYDTYSYDKINEEQLTYLKQQFNFYLTSENVADIISDVEAGYLSKEDVYSNLKSNYDKAISAFKARYGFRPYKAGELIKNSWVIEEDN